MLANPAYTVLLAGWLADCLDLSDFWLTLSIPWIRCYGVHSFAQAGREICSAYLLTYSMKQSPS